MFSSALRPDLLKSLPVLWSPEVQQVCPGSVQLTFAIDRTSFILLHTLVSLSLCLFNTSIVVSLLQSYLVFCPWLPDCPHSQQRLVHCGLYMDAKQHPTPQFFSCLHLASQSCACLVTYQCPAVILLFPPSNTPCLLLSGTLRF